jgi:hypothetical protein
MACQIFRSYLRCLKALTIVDLGLLDHRLDGCVDVVDFLFDDGGGNGDNVTSHRLGGKAYSSWSDILIISIN